MDIDPTINAIDRRADFAAEQLNLAHTINGLIAKRKLEDTIYTGTLGFQTLMKWRMVL